MTRLLFPRKIRQNGLLLLSVYLLCCHTALAQQLATEQDFTEVDVATSADGRYTVFSNNEFATDAANNPVLQASHLYLRDTNNDTTVLVYTGAHFMLTANSASNSNLGPVISANGKFIAFRMIENDRMELYRYDIDSRETVLVSADGTDSSYPTFYTNNIWGVNIGPDGRYLTYVRGIHDSSIGNRSILYLYDSLDGSLNRIVNDDSCALGNFSGPDLSADGRYFAYVYYCAEQGLFLYDIDNRTNVQLETSGVTVWNDPPFISENNHFIRFNAPGDVAGQIYDRILSDVYPFGTTSECIDSDADGWGYNEYLEASCVVDQVAQSACDYSDADLYGGWGWNASNSQSCAPLENVSDEQPTAQCIDSDGDGFGWDGTATCTMGLTIPVTNPTANNDCDYSNADLYNGWGWNATDSQSCPPLMQCIDTDGDGWGWDGSASCIP